MLVDALTTSFLVPSSMITAGTTYTFGVMSRNIYGSSLVLSSLTSVTAATVPDKGPTPSVSIGTGLDATNVIVSWDGSTLTHGASIDQYQVQFLTSTGSYVSDSSCAPSSTVSAQFIARQCSIPMTTIISITGLTLDSLIRVRVAAHNVEGWGLNSDINTSGATIETTPEVISSLDYDPSSLSSTQV